MEKSNNSIFIESIFIVNNLVFFIQIINKMMVLKGKKTISSAIMGELCQIHFHRTLNLCFILVHSFDSNIIFFLLLKLLIILSNLKFNHFKLINLVY